MLNFNFIFYTPLQGRVYEKAGPYFTRAGVKFGPYSTRALARVEYGPNFTPAQKKYGSKNI